MFGVSVELEACAVRRGMSSLTLFGECQKRVIACADAQGIGGIDGVGIEGRM